MNSLRKMYQNQHPLSRKGFPQQGIYNPLGFNVVQLTTAVRSDSFSSKELGVRIDRYPIALIFFGLSSGVREPTPIACEIPSKRIFAQ